MTTTLQRFLEAHDRHYHTALSEIRSGRKLSHWMWFIFPQIDGLGRSDTAKYYAIQDLDEAKVILENSLLNKNLVEISNALFSLDGKTAAEIFGSPDDAKLRSSMTLFANVDNASPVFQQVLDKYFEGQPDTLTIQIINRR